MCYSLVVSIEHCGRIGCREGKFCDELGLYLFGIVIDGIVIDGIVIVGIVIVSIVIVGIVTFEQRLR